jgi:hypothetical protein
MKRLYKLPDPIDAFFEIKTQGMNKNALIVSLVTKWLFSNLDVVKEYEEYIASIKKDQANRMLENRWKVYKRKTT